MRHGLLDAAAMLDAKERRMGRMSKQKGKRGEREAAAELGQLLGCHARRGVQYQGSADSPDVVLEGVNVHVECKRTETINVYKAIEQATCDAGQKVPIVWHRRNGKPSVVIIETARLAEFVAETHKSLENKGETCVKCETA
jgi:Holliday junction resolvase